MNPGAGRCSRPGPPLTLVRSPTKFNRHGQRVARPPAQLLARFPALVFGREQAPCPGVLFFVFNQTSGARIGVLAESDRYSIVGYKVLYPLSRIAGPG